MIFSGEADIDKLPELWNSKCQEYLGITPENDAEGILQDIHWSFGEFGYFPSYAIGSAVASQIYAKIVEVMPVEDYLKEGNLTPIREFLRDSIHKYGATKNTNQILMDITQEEFNADYYVNYLKDKYEKLYNL